MRLTDEQMQELLNRSPHAADLFNMCQPSTPNAEVRAALEGLVHEATELLHPTATKD